MNRSLRGGHFVLLIVSAPVIPGAEELVVYEGNDAKWKQLTDTVTYIIVKDSLPVYTND